MSRPTNAEEERLNVFTVKEELDKDDKEKENEEKDNEDKWVDEKKASGMDTGRLLHLEDKLNRDDETEVRQPLTVST